MDQLTIDIQKDIYLGVLSFNAIAYKYEVPLSWVMEVWDEMCIEEYSEE